MQPGRAGEARQSGPMMSRDSRKSVSGVCHPVRKDVLLQLTDAVALTLGPQRDVLSTLKTLSS